MKSYIIENGVLAVYKGNAAQPKIPNGIKEIGKCAFLYYDKLKTLKIPSSVINIDYEAFMFCKNITNIKIPNSVTNIENSAFYGCENLSSVKIPNSVTAIGSNAFRGCRNLSKIEIPNSVEYIGSDAFSNIKKIQLKPNANGAIRAFKGFKRDWTCMNFFQYEIGKTYHQKGKIECCKNGFHACPNPLAVFNYYDGDLSYRHFAEVELSGTMDCVGDKVAASTIKIVRELSVSDLAEIFNSMEKV